MNKLLQLADLWWSWMVSSTWQVALLSALIWLLSVIFSKGSARFRYLLWLLVFVKLLIPPDFGTPWSPLRVLETLPIQFDLPALQKSVEPAPSLIISKETLSEGTTPATLPNTQAAGAFHLPISLAAMALWALIAASLLTILLIQWRMFARKIFKTLEDPPSPLGSIFEEQKAKAGVRRCSLHVSIAVGTPGVFGAIRPRILLPRDWEDRFSPEELAAVLAHELAHVKRNDILSAWATTVLTCLYWFHPAVWVANLRLRREREMACDDLAIMMVRQKHTDYASIILRVAELFNGSVPAGAGLLGLLEMSDNLLYRIRSIGDATRPRTLGWISFIVLAVLLPLLPMGEWRAQAAVPSSSYANAGPTPPEITTPPSPVSVNSAFVPPSSADQGAVSTDAAGVALLEFGYVGASASLAEQALQLRTLIAERLANVPDFRLVERDKLDHLLSELHLDASGLVSSNTASRIGALTGAKTLVTGTLMSLDNEWVVTARLINAQSSEIQAVRVTGNESNGLLSLADATAALIAAKISTAAPPANPPGTPTALEKQTEAIRTALAGKPLPRVAIAVPESHLGVIVPDPAGQTEIMRVLIEAGYPVVDVSSFLKSESGSWWMNLLSRNTPDGNGQELAVNQGGRSASALLHDKRIDKLKQNADILILGEAFSEYAGENYGFKTCRARVELKALDTAKETVAAATSEHAAAADVAEMIAGKSALREAGGQAGLTLARALAEYWEKQSK